MTRAYRLRDGVPATVETLLAHGWETVDTAPDSTVLTHATLDLTPDDATGAHVGRAFAVSRLYLTVWHPDGPPVGALVAGPAYPWEPCTGHQISVRAADRLINDLSRPELRMNVHRRYRRHRTVFSQPLFWVLVLAGCAAAALLALI